MNSDNHIDFNCKDGEEFCSKNNLTLDEAFNILAKEFLRIKKLENQKLNE